MTFDEARGVRCMVMRGGTSKGAYFLRDDLPRDRDQRDELLRSIMGSPDARQIDGIGGGHPLTSKVAVVAQSADPKVDVDYLFLQIGVDDALVSDRQNCGNLLAGVAPFAIERGLVDTGGADVSVRIRMLNTDSIAIAHLSVHDGMPVYGGATAIAGVPGTANAITLGFEDIEGATCGALLPTGSIVDTIEGMPATLIDNGMPVVVIAAADVGVTGYERCTELEENRDLRAQLEALRITAGSLMNLGDVSTTTVPKITIVAAPVAGGTISTRTFIPHRCHDAIGVLGAVSVATAARLPGSVAAGVAAEISDDVVAIEHPTGIFEALVDAQIGRDGAPVVSHAGIVRTARKLMDGVVFPREY